MAIAFAVDDLVSRLGTRAAGVVATPAGWVPGCGSIADHLVGRARVTALLALEHGLRGDLQDGVHFDTYVDERSGVPVYSFYGGTGHTFPREVMETLDVVVFHAQDVTHRAYTYKQTLAATLALAAETGVSVIVLDRPTPLGYMGSQGPLWTQFFPEPLPVIHAVTLGELARWLVRAQDLDVDLEVIPVRGWRRHMTWRDTGLPWIPPSPNIPFVDSAIGYACTGILQHTSVSEGRGCCKPFEYVGLPGADAEALAARLNGQALPGVLFREVYFSPAFNKYQGTLCAGIHVMVQEETRIEPLRTMLAILKAFADICPDSFKPTAGFGRWLDGTAWDVHRLAGLDTEAFLAESARCGRQFTETMADALLYEA